MGKLDQLRALPMRSLYRKADPVPEPTPVPVLNSSVTTAPPAPQAVTTPQVTTRQGKYKDPEARKAYQREHMRKLRAARK